MDWAALARVYWTCGRIDQALAALRTAPRRDRADDAELDVLRIDILRAEGQRAEWEDAGHDTHPPVGRRLRPAPYVAIPDFLDGSTMQHLRALVATHRDAFTPATVGAGAGRLDDDRRRSLRLRDPAAERLARVQFLPRLRPVVPGLLAALKAGAGTPGRIECNVSASRCGDFFKPHRDDMADAAPRQSSGDRVLSYVCWIHREPSRFTGGELMLHDASAESYGVVAGTRFPPTAGTMVVFPSSAFHSMLPVGGDGVDLIDARLAITGHICTHRSATSIP